MVVPSTLADDKPLRSSGRRGLFVMKGLSHKVEGPPKYALPRQQKRIRCLGASHFDGLQPALLIRVRAGRPHQPLRDRVVRQALNFRLTLHGPRRWRLQAFPLQEEPEQGWRNDGGNQNNDYGRCEDLVIDQAAFQTDACHDQTHLAARHHS